MSSMPPLCSNTRWRTFAELFRNCTSEETSVSLCSSHLSYKRKWFQFLLALLRPASANCPCTGSPRMLRMTSQYLANLTAPFQSIYLSHHVTENPRYFRFASNLDSRVISSLANYWPFFRSFRHIPSSGALCAWYRNDPRHGVAVGKSLFAQNLGPDLSRQKSGHL